MMQKSKESETSSDRNILRGVRDFFEQKAEAVTSFALFFTVLFWFGFWAHIGVDAHHDGILLKPALDVASGKMLFRDTFTQYGALTTLLQAWVCELFGAKLMVIRWLTVFFYAGSSVLVWRISRPLLAGWFRIIPILLIFTQAPFYFWTFHSWSSVYALFFLLLTCRLLQIGLEKKCSGWFWFLIGCVSILGFWCRQPLGLVFPAAGTVVLASHWRFHDSWTETTKKLVLFLLGALGISAVFLIWIIQNHALIPFFHQSLGFAFDFVASRSQAMTATSAQCGRMYGILDFCSKLSWIFIFRNYFYGSITVIVIGIFGILLYKGFRYKNLPFLYWQLLPVVLLSGMSLHQYYPVPCIRHCYWAAFPAFVLFGWGIQQGLHPLNVGTKSLGKIGKIFGFLLIGIAVFCTWKNYSTNDRCFSTMKSISELQELEVYRRPGVLEGVWMLPWEVRFWDDLYDGVEKIPESQRNEMVVNTTINAFYSLIFPNQTNWHPMYVNWGNGVDPRYSDKMYTLIYSGKVNIVTLESVTHTNQKNQICEDTREEVLQSATDLCRLQMFQAAKCLQPDAQIVTFPEFQSYGIGICETPRGKYAVVILAPTGKTLRQSCEESKNEQRGEK